TKRLRARLCGATVGAWGKRECGVAETKGGGGPAGDRMAEDRAEGRVVIKKYANRRLYNTAKSSYVTLDDLARMVRAGEDFSVYDAKTGEDITRSVLTQIIV